ncbi:MAG: hypothetical protein Q7R80_02095, partial [bacterium]|nr:hypothetical protein [bacterium]
MEGDRAFSETSIVDTDMPASVFILGREPHLSVAEIAAVVGDGADWTKAELSAEALIVESGICPPKADPTWAENLESGISARSLMNRLGGTIKIGEAWRRISHDEFLISHDEAIGTFILSACGGSAVGGEHSTRKVHFGFSVYNLGGGQKRVEEVRRALTRGAAKQKTALKEHGRTARWVTSRESTLSSVIVQKEKLLPEQNGIEVLVLVGPNHITLARTLTVQPFEDWGRRDYGKPARNMTRGMLPPKLARAMVNMAGVKSSKLKAQSSNQIQKSKGKNSVFGIRYSEFTLLDPFCGTGTVLLEALALGCRVIGSDNDAAAIAESRANIQWALGADAEQHDRVQL